MWCKNCNIETNEPVCPRCNAETAEELPVEIYWCHHCKTPVVQNTNQADKGVCPLCGRITSSSKGKYSAYGDSTIQRFRNIIARIIQGCSDMRLCDNIFEDSYFLLSPEEYNEVIHSISMIMKSLPVEIEIKMIDYLLSDYKADGETVGFLLVVSCGLRIIESTAVLFGNIMPLLYHNDCSVIMIYEDGVALTSSLKSSGKSKNADREIPLFDRVREFLAKRKEYIANELRKKGIEADIDKLPIACSGKNFLIGCTMKQISDRAREIFSLFGVEPKVYQYIDAEMVYGNLKKIKEKNPTGYLGRHIFATHLALCDLTESEMQAVIGHEIEKRGDERSDFANEEVIYSIKKKMDRLPLYRSHNGSIHISNSVSLSGNGPLCVMIDQPLDYLCILAECEEAYDTIKVETDKPIDGARIIVGKKEARYETGSIDVISKYEELFMQNRKIEKY